MTSVDPKDYYDILGVPRTATSEEIRKAYKHLALQWHPDRHRTNKEDAARRFIEVNDAYRHLVERKLREEDNSIADTSKTSSNCSDEDSKQPEEDATPRQPKKAKSESDLKASEHSEPILEEKLPKPEPSPTPSKKSKPRSRSSPNVKVWVRQRFYLSEAKSQSDPTSDGPPPTAEDKSKEDDTKRNVPSEDDEVGIPIPSSTVTSVGEIPSEWIFPISFTLKELYNGATHRYRIIRNLLSGKMEEKIVEVKIQPGWRSGTKIRYSGLGNERADGHPQDIVFVIEEAPHYRFTRAGDNLRAKVELELYQALAGDGGVCRMKGLDGHRLEFPLPEGIIRPGDETTVVGRGMPIRRGGKVVGNGDLVIQWVIKFPENLSASQKKVLKSFSQD